VIRFPARQALAENCRVWLLVRVDVSGDCIGEANVDVGVGVMAVVVVVVGREGERREVSREEKGREVVVRLDIVSCHSHEARNGIYGGTVVDVRMSLGSKRPQRGEGSPAEHGGCLNWYKFNNPGSAEGVQGDSSLNTESAGVVTVVPVAVEAERKLKLRRRRRTDPQNLSASRFLF
jgi:hypothetical protein